MSALYAWQLGKIAPSVFVICLPFARDSVLSSSTTTKHANTNSKLCGGFARIRHITKASLFLSPTERSEITTTSPV